MKEYLGVKVVHAEPCKGYNNKAVNTANAYPHDAIFVDGYKVVYEDGYSSWSPKNVFETAYRASIALDATSVPEVKEGSPAYQLRVVEEAKDLQLRTLKLYVYTMTVDFTMLDREEQVRMKQQLLAMQYYFTVLVERIKNFK